MTESFSQAANMCSTLVDVTRQITKDATEAVLEVADAYQIRLEAHELFCRNALGRTEEIQNQFRINGKAALQIGNQLEFAESKRKRCESASMQVTGVLRTPHWSCLIRQTTTLQHPTRRWSAMALQRHGRQPRALLVLQYVAGRDSLGRIHSCGGSA